jgi:hypothetical protein
MSKYSLMLMLAILLSAGIVAILDLIARARDDGAAAAALVSVVHEAAERIARDPASRESLPAEVEMYFDWNRDIITGEFGEVPDTTRKVFVEALTALAIAYPDAWRTQHALGEAGRVGFARVDEALFRVYTGQRERGYKEAAIVIESYGHLPPDQAVPYLSRLTAQQDDDAAAMTAIEVMAEAGQAGADAIMALERAGTVNDYVWRAIRWGSDGTNEVCPHVPEFTPCVHNEILGNPVGTMQLSCRDLPRMREAFDPREYQDMMRQLCRQER